MHDSSTPPHGAGAARADGQDPAGPRQLLLLGCGPAHMELLRAWTRQPLVNVQITLVAAQTRPWYAPRVSGFVAGHWLADDCQWDLEPRVQRSGVHWARASVLALHADARIAELDDGQTLNFDWLSIDVPGVQNRDTMDVNLPGAREHALFVHPLNAFCTLWPQVLEMAQSKPLRFTVVGAGVTGCELAMALQYRLPHTRVTLLAGAQPPLARSTPALQSAVQGALKQRKITVLQERALSVTANTVQLACGAALASDVTILATGIQLPHWLANSGLAQDDQGCLAMDSHLCSSSHPQVFVTGAYGRGGPMAEQRWSAHTEGLALSRNLAASVAGQPLAALARPSTRRQTVACGNRYAILSLGGYILQGRWVWWLTRWRDQRWLRQWSQIVR